MTPNYQWRVILWEPVDGMGERIMVGVIIRHLADIGRELDRGQMRLLLVHSAEEGARQVIEHA